MLYNRYDDSVIGCVASQREGSGFQTIICMFPPLVLCLPLTV